MALVGQIQDLEGISIQDCYIKIFSISITNKDSVSISAVLFSVKDGVKFRAIDIIENISSGDVVFDTYFTEEVLKEIGNSLFTQGYKYLNSLPKFSGLMEG